MLINNKKIKIESTKTAEKNVFLSKMPFDMIDILEIYSILIIFINNNIIAISHEIIGRVHKPKK